MKRCPQCTSEHFKKDGLIYTTIMAKAGKRKRQVQRYRCEEGHRFTFQVTGKYTDPFIEWVAFVYLNCLSLNTTIEIVRAYYETEVLSKGLILDFLEQIADILPTLDDIDTVFHPLRSGYLAVDGVWFTFRSMEIVLLVCFDPETFDIITAHWSLQEDEASYTKLLLAAGTKIGLDAIKGIYGDGDNGLIRSLKKHFPLIPFQLCIVHKEMRMGQLVPIKSANRSRNMSETTKQEIQEFQALFRSVIYAASKQESLLNLKQLQAYVASSEQVRFKRAYRSLIRNFTHTLTHFDHQDMQRDNNLLECFNGIIKPRLRLMKGFKKYDNLERYLTLFLLDYRFHPLKESRFKERRGLCPLQVAGVQLPTIHNFLSFLRTSFQLTFSTR